MGKLEEHMKMLYEAELIFAEQGSVPSMTTVATFYSRGWHVTRNIEEANNWFYRAAVSGDLDSLGLVSAIIKDFENSAGVIV